MTRLPHGSKVIPAEHWAKDGIITKGLNMPLIKEIGVPDKDLQRYSVRFLYHVSHYLGMSEYKGYRIVHIWSSCPQSVLITAKKLWKYTGTDFQIIQNED